MTGRSRPEGVSTKLLRIAKLAGEAPEMVLTTLAHHIDVEFLHEAYRLEGRLSTGSGATTLTVRL